MSNRRRVISSFSLVLVASVAASLTGCGKPPSAVVTNRLWVSTVPTSPRQATTAFAIASARGRNIGVFHRGSVYEAKHQAFNWAARGERAQLTLLQDNETHELRVETCKPSRGFDRCVMLHGDPTGAVRYQSRKRWAFRDRKSAGVLDFDAVVHELEASDPELSAFVAE